MPAQRLSAGLGSNPLGLDRGWGDSGQLVTFRVVGPKLVVAAENTRYRATADNPLEQDAVDDFDAQDLSHTAASAEGMPPSTCAPYDTTVPVSVTIGRL